MIRLLLRLLIFVAGLAGAAVWLGEMHHLRRAAAENLPGWTGAIAPDARVGQGQMSLPPATGLPVLTLGWSAMAPGVDGLRWGLAISGQGVDLKAVITIPFWPETVTVDQGDGGVNLGELPGLVLPLAGTIRLNGLDAQLAGLMQMPVVSGTFTATASGIGIAGTDLGGGPLTGQIDRSGAWSGALSLTAGASDATGRISGYLASGSGMLDLTITDLAGLSAASQTLLLSVGQRDGAGLRIAIPLQYGR